jgi:hypothetical protein
MEWFNKDFMYQETGTQLKGFWVIVDTRITAKFTGFLLLNSCRSSYTNDIVIGFFFGYTSTFHTNNERIRKQH